VTYGKVIIRPETWLISKNILGIPGNDKDKSTFEQRFASFRQKWGIPKFVFMNEGDNRLMLDIDNPAHRAEIYSAIRKTTLYSTTLTEVPCEFGDYVVKDANGKKYVTEIIVPFFAETGNFNDSNVTDDSVKIEKLRTFSNVSQNRSNIKREQLMLLPGNEKWLYYKLYGCSKRQDELIVTAYETLEKFVADGLAQKYFFIRYSDPEPHLRLRIMPTGKGMAALLPAASGWLNNLHVCGLISKAMIDSYTREAERYGGPELIEHVESYFCSDSKLVMQLLTQYRYGDLRFSMDYVGVSFIASALEAFGMTVDEQLVLLESISDKKTYKKEFQNNRHTIINVVNSTDDWFVARSYVPKPEIYDWISANAIELKKYAEAVYELDKKGKLTNSVKEICLSIVHMFCNRLMGNNAWERKVYSLTMHGVHGFAGFSKHRKNKLLDLELPETLI
jgi:thiopeptide-type bacteriocin biosynthesis protein